MHVLWKNEFLALFNLLLKTMVIRPISCYIKDFPKYVLQRDSTSSYQPAGSNAFSVPLVTVMIIDKTTIQDVRGPFNQFTFI